MKMLICSRGGEVGGRVGQHLSYLQPTDPSDLAAAPEVLDDRSKVHWDRQQTLCATLG